MPVRFFALVWSLAAVGCSSSETEDPAAAPTPEEVVEAPQAKVEKEVAPEATQSLMHGHWKKAVVAREALIRGDVPTAAKAMQWLATHQRAEDLPADLRGLLTDMQERAAKFELARNVREASDVFAEVLSRCGSCHEATGKGPKVSDTPMPEGKDAISHLRRHHWATTRMWEGLVTSSPRRFDEAVSSLVEEPLTAADLGSGNLPIEEVARLDAHVHGLWAEVQEPDTEQGRIELYARTLATCATCHRAMGRGPKPVAAP